MSVVAVRILKAGGFQMASDSIVTRGYTKSKGDRSFFAKMVDVDGLVVGSVGLAEEIGLLTVYAMTRKPEAPTVRAILTYLGEFAEWKQKKINKGGIENSYLFGFERKIFHSNGWFVEEVRTFEAIGAGEDFALAALHLGHDARSAVRVATELSIYCEAPILVITRR